MKPISILLLALFLCSGTLEAQSRTDEASYPMKGVHVLVLNLSGKSRIHPAIREELQLSSALQTYGFIWGWKYPDERPEFRIAGRASHDTMYLTTPAVFQPKTIGINTYSESIENIIHVPATIQVVVRRADILIVDAGIRMLEVKKTNHLQIDIAKDEIKTLICRSASGLSINTVSGPDMYEVHSVGNSSYDLQAEQIEITFKQ
jgi:hypothetical protein